MKCYFQTVAKWLLLNSGHIMCTKSVVIVLYVGLPLLFTVISITKGQVTKLLC